MTIAAEIRLCKVHLCKLWVIEENCLELWLKTEVDAAKLQIMMIYVRSQKSSNCLNRISFKVLQLYYYIFFIALYCIQNILQMSSSWESEHFKFIAYIKVTIYHQTIIHSWFPHSCLLSAGPLWVSMVSHELSSTVKNAPEINVVVKWFLNTLGISALFLLNLTNWKVFYCKVFCWPIKVFCFLYAHCKVDLPIDFTSPYFIPFMM